MNEGVNLRPRHKQLILLLCEGMTVKEAAHAMGLTPGTGKEYMEQARKRAGARTTWQLVAALCKGKVQ